MADWRHIQQASQILASESGAVVRDWGGRLPLVLAYANSYAVGMSSLAMHSLYHWFNALPGVVCERAFAWLDRHAGPNDPLLTIESQRPVNEATALAFSVSFEMDYFHVVQMLRRAQIPVLADERDEGDPFVLMGGPAVSANPAVMAPLADAIVIGEAEELIGALTEVLRESYAMARADVFAALAKIPSVYVPAVHGDSRTPDLRIPRRYLVDLDAWPTTTSVVTPKAEFGDMHLIEISRGCARGCRFCMAGYLYRPKRERSLEAVLKSARQGLRTSRKIGLVASAVSDYSQIEPLVGELRSMGANISISSLRVRPLSPLLVQALADSGAQSITLAPEAGSERLRAVIHKGVRHEDVLAATHLANQHNFRSLKLYYMIGLPTETDDDIAALVDQARQVKALFDREVIVNVTPFVPKPHTPFQHVAVTDTEVVLGRLERMRHELQRERISLRAEPPQSTRVQALLARADEQVGLTLADMRRPTPKRFERALRDAGLDAAQMLSARPAEGPFPWDMVDACLPEELLMRQWSQAQRDAETETHDRGTL